MTAENILTLLLFMAILAATTPLLGSYMTRLFAGERTLLSPVLSPIEQGFYKLAGIDPTKEQSWVAYTFALLAFNAVGFSLLFAVLRFRDVLPFNPAGMAAVPPDLAFNTAVSFVTNTNWQAYGGVLCNRRCRIHLQERRSLFR